MDSIFVSCGSDGGIDMITYSVLAQSFLTSILRVGVWIISRSSRSFSLMGLSSALTGSDAILAWVSSDVIGQIVSFVLALLGCSFARFYKMVVGLFGA